MPIKHDIIVSSSSSKVIEKTITDADAEVFIHAKKETESTVSVVFEPVSDCTISLKIVVDTNATLTVLCLQATKSKHISITQKAEIHDGGVLHVLNITLGSDVEQSVVSHLLGANAVSDIDWIFYAHNNDCHMLSARNIFEACDGGGEITIKGIAEDAAHVRCDGQIVISAEGKGTDTYLTEDILMLDATAKVDVIPRLEIQTNDVKASHSATVSKVTPEDLFYFASRGIQESKARQMYVQGFLGDLTKRIVDKEIREKVVESIKRKYST